MEEAACQFQRRDPRTQVRLYPYGRAAGAPGSSFSAWTLCSQSPTYYLLRAADLNTIAALTVCVSIPAIGATVTLIREGRVDAFAVLVIASAAISVGLSVVSGNPRPLLAKKRLDYGCVGVMDVLGSPSHSTTHLYHCTSSHGGQAASSVRLHGTNCGRTSPTFEGSGESQALCGEWPCSSTRPYESSWRMRFLFRSFRASIPALFAVTFLILQFTTNVYFHRSGLYRMLGAAWSLEMTVRHDHWRIVRRVVAQRQLPIHLTGGIPLSSSTTPSHFAAAQRSARLEREVDESTLSFGS